MEETTTSKELTLVSPVDAIAKRSKPHLMKVGDRYLSSDAKWHPSLAVEYVMVHAKTRWVSVGELAKTFFGANIPTTKKKIRRRLPSLFSRLLAGDYLLVSEADATTNRVSAVKLYDPRSEEERQGLQLKLERMRQRKELTAAQFEKALMLTAVSEPRESA